MTGIKNLIIGIFLLCLSTFFLLLSGEIVTRILWYYQNKPNSASLEEQLKLAQALPLEDVGNKSSLAGLVKPSDFADIVYELKPHLVGKFQNRNLVTNSMGLRDKEFSLVKDPHTYRIIGLGDSIMFGWGVEQNQSYFKLVEEALNSLPNQQLKYELINFAVPGYNTAMEVATLEHRAIKYNPDLIVIHFVRNDYEVPFFMQKHYSVFSFSKFFLLDWIKSRLLGVKKSSENELHFAGNVNKEEVLDKYNYMTGEAGFRNAMKKLAEIAQEAKIPVIIIYGSATNSMKNVLEHKVAEKWGFSLIALKPYVDNYFKMHEIGNTTAERRKLLQVSPSDSHPNELGHRIYAQALFDQLIKILSIDTKVNFLN